MHHENDARTGLPGRRSRPIVESIDRKSIKEDSLKTLPIAALVLTLAAPAFAGDIHGHVTCTGLRDNADAVVYVDAIPGKTFPAPTEHALIDQKDMQFQPHVTVVLEGTTVDFLNSDAFLHNVFSPDKCADRMNLGSWPQGTKRSFTFKKPCAATLLCNVHPEMEGYVVVVPTPYHAITDKSGAFTIKDVPDGSYTVKVWQPKLKETSRSVTVSGATQADFELQK
jgi:plastocyanin